MTFAVARSSSSSHIPSGQPWLGILHIQTAKAFQEFRGNGGGGVTAGEQTLMKHRTKPTEGGGGGADSQGSQFHVSRGVRCPRSTSLPNPAVNPGAAAGLGLGGISVSTEQDNQCKAQEQKLHLEPSFAIRHTGKSQECQVYESNGVGDIYIFYIYIVSLLYISRKAKSISFRTRCWT